MSALLCHVLGVSSVDGEGRGVGVVSCVGECQVSWRRRWEKGTSHNLGMDDMAQIGGLVAGHGREEVCWPLYPRRQLYKIRPLSSRLGEPLTSQDML